MREFITSRIQSFRFALSGWWFVVKTQRNAWIHAVASISVIVIALWLAIPARDLAVLILTIGFVWTSEFINTALEAVVDLIHSHPSSPGKGWQRCRRRSCAHCRLVFCIDWSAFVGSTINREA